MFLLIIISFLIFPNVIVANSIGQTAIQKVDSKTTLYGTVNINDVPSSTYVIGSHMFTRQKTKLYDGVLTTEHIMLASRTIAGNSIKDMKIIYKDARGVWKDGLSGVSVKMPDTIDIQYVNLEKNPIVMATLSSDLSDVFFSRLSKQSQPKKLTVLAFKYNNYTYDMSDQELEQYWSDYIFGNGSISSDDASINDYFKEISNGKFYYEPELVGDNKTGVYVVNFDKDYSYSQNLHYEWPYHEFTYDVAHAMDELIINGLDISSYSAEGINNTNYSRILSRYCDADADYFNPSWFSTNTVLCIFPPYNMEKVDFSPLSSEYNNFGLYAHVNYDSSFATIAHELLHTMGTIDIYNFGDYGSDIMSSSYLRVPHKYDTMHIDPYYKIVFDWTNTKIVEGTGYVKLYPSTDEKYMPLIVKTDDNNQYYIIENRKGTGFDHGINYTGCNGINIWRIDKLGMEAISNRDRKGMELLGVLDNYGEFIVTDYYSNFDEISDVGKVTSNIKITYVKENTDGSITVNIERL